MRYLILATTLLACEVTPPGGVDGGLFEENIEPSEDGSVGTNEDALLEFHVFDRCLPQPIPPMPPDQLKAFVDCLIDCDPETTICDCVLDCLNAVGGL
jgi:hypothetical protein